jgi:hypothetical protein
MFIRLHFEDGISSWITVDFHTYAIIWQLEAGWASTTEIRHLSIDSKVTAECNMLVFVFQFLYRRSIAEGIREDLFIYLWDIHFRSRPLTTVYRPLHKSSTFLKAYLAIPFLWFRRSTTHLQHNIVLNFSWWKWRPFIVWIWFVHVLCKYNS